MAALVGEVKLASNNRRTDQRARVGEASARQREARTRELEANEADSERYRAAADREQTARRSRIQARFLTKNYFAIGFKLDYAKANGDLSNYCPDFIVKLYSGSAVIVETKGLLDVDVPQKIRRLAQWIADLNALQAEVAYNVVFVAEAGFSNHRPRSFAELLQSFQDFKT